MRSLLESTAAQWVWVFQQALNIGMLQRSGAGNGYFPSIGAGKIQPQNNRDAIISIRV
jgi:hypothetical protein